ncbi:hypothetical protein SNEBB_005805 [Seison nebaliae]|nr:hypothetical protein SNEBB_005805 [Seison nebaliae]
MHRTFLTRLICGLLYGIIIVLGTFGNSLTIFIIFKNRHDHAFWNVTNVFIANLAFVDIGRCLLNVTFTFFMVCFMETDEWPFGAFVCYVVQLSLGISVYISTFTSLAIAVNRYYVIIYPFKKFISLRTAFIIVLLIWIAALIIITPILIYTDHRTCAEVWPSKKADRTYTCVSDIIQYFLPLSIIAFCYIRIWFALTSNMEKRKHSSDLKKKHRTNRILVAMIAIFAICWFPLIFLHFLIKFEIGTHRALPWHLYHLIAHLVAMSSTVYNPFLYAHLSENFDNEFRKLLCLSKKSKISTTIVKNAIAIPLAPNGKTLIQPRNDFVKLNNFIDNSSIDEKKHLITLGANTTTDQLIRNEERTTSI